MSFNSIDNFTNLLSKIREVPSEIRSINIYDSGRTENQPISQIDTAQIILFSNTMPMTTPGGDVTFNSDGSITINEAGLYILTIKYQIEKTHPSGVLNWYTYSTAQVGAGQEVVVGSPVYIRMDGNKPNSQKDISRFINVVTPGTVFRLYQAADSQGGGTSDGGLFTFTPTPGSGPNGGNIQAAPSAAMIITKFTHKDL